MLCRLGEEINEASCTIPNMDANISLKVHGQDGDQVFFLMKRSTALKKLMNAYCERQSVDYDSIMFMFNGQRLGGDQTPGELEMEDDDEIHAMPHDDGAQLAMEGMTISKKDTNPGYITLKVIQGLDGCEMFFRIKGSTRLMKLMNIYCERHSLDYGSFVFIFGGRCLRGEQTPDELALKEGDQIHALMIKKGC